jgi:hypothetical protein
MMLLLYLSFWRIECVLQLYSQKISLQFTAFPLCIMQLIYSESVVHLQSDHIHDAIKLQWKYFIMLLQ